VVGQRPELAEHIKKLEENGFVETEYATREKKIALTGFGRTLAKAVKAAI
jgi:Mn-dependent DtxR family transcriptional regulator